MDQRLQWAPQNGPQVNVAFVQIIENFYHVLDISWVYARGVSHASVEIQGVAARGLEHG